MKILEQPQDILALVNERQQRFATQLRSKGIDLPSASVLRNSVYRLSEASLAIDAADAPKPVLDTSALKATFVITTPSQDRYGDIVVPKGCIPHLKNYEKNPRVFFSHKSTSLPIGSCRTPAGAVALQFFDDKVLGTVYFNEETEESRAVCRLVMRKELEASSIGFKPVKASVIELDDDHDDRDEDGNEVVYFDGWLPLKFSSWDMLEWSIVPVPANADALACHLSRGTIEDVKVTDSIRKMFAPYAAPLKGYVRGADLTAGALSINEVRKLHGQDSDPGDEDDKGRDVKEAKSLIHRHNREDVVRWNRSLSRRFDIADANLKPSTPEYELVSKFLGCPVKEIYESHEAVPSAKMGSFLTAWREITAPLQLLDTRNVHASGTESPPVYEVIQLNSKQSDEFLIEGMLFYQHAGGKFVCGIRPSWYGLHLTFYATFGQQSHHRKLLAQAWEAARERYNFLKGEAFSLSGEFLPKTAEGWDDIFITPDNEHSLTQTLTALNAKGTDFANRGTIFMGPPGTGKTLAGRVIRNLANATFVWVSARDFYRSGAFGSFTYAFDLARELAPCVLFFEDVDNWISPYTVDLLKTEMDGIGRSKGIWTVLTTNFPEQLPEALIDRPGRFHDVLSFDLPDATARQSMVRRWLPEADTATTALAVRETDGYSGAYVYELCHFALTLCEQDGLTLDTAVTRAVQKIKDQKTLIQARHAPRRKSLESLPVTRSLVTKSFGTTASKECEPSTTSLDELVKCIHECVEEIKADFKLHYAKDEAFEAEIVRRLEELLQLERAEAQEEAQEEPEKAAAADYGKVLGVLQSLAASQQSLQTKFFELTGR